MKGGEGLKSVYLRSIKWGEKFEGVNGSYYDYVAQVSAFSKEVEKNMRNDLLIQDFREIKTNNNVLVFEKERHVVRIYRIY